MELGVDWLRDVASSVPAGRVAASPGTAAAVSHVELATSSARQVIAARHPAARPPTCSSLAEKRPALSTSAWHLISASSAACALLGSPLPASCRARANSTASGAESSSGCSSSHMALLAAAALQLVGRWMPGRAGCGREMEPQEKRPAGADRWAAAAMPGVQHLAFWRPAGSCAVYLERKSQVLGGLWRWRGGAGRARAAAVISERGGGVKGGGAGRQLAMERKAGASSPRARARQIAASLQHCGHPSSTRHARTRLVLPNPLISLAIAPSRPARALSLSPSAAPLVASIQPPGKPSNAARPG